MRIPVAAFMLVSAPLLAQTTARSNRPDTAAHALDSVRVTGQRNSRATYARRAIRSATRTEVPLRDLPQSVSVLAAPLIAERAFQSMADVARVLPGISMGAGEGHRDAPTLRGVSSTADLYVDGVRDDAQYLRDLYNADRIEVLRGPNAMAFGRGGGGGVINRVSKDATWYPVRTITLEGGSYAHRRGTLDVGGGRGTVAARLTGVLENSDRYRRFTSLERGGLNPTVAVTWRGAMLRAGYEDFVDRRTVDRGQPSFAGAPARADARTFFGDPSVNRARAAVRAWNASFERGSAERLLLRSVLRRVAYDKFYQNTVPGAVNAAMTALPLTAYRNWTNRVNTFSQTDLTATRRTGRVVHTLLAGVELGGQGTDNFRETGYFGGTATAMTIPFAAPTIAAPVTFRQSASDADNRAEVAIAAAYAQHQAALGAHWLTTVGVRWERFAMRFHDRRSGLGLRRTDETVSPRAGLVYKPVMPLSLYASYGTSFLPSAGDQFSSLTATTSTLAPERFANREIGARWEVRPALLLEAAAYGLDRTNTSAPDPANPGKLVQTGRSRSRGVELQLTGAVTGAWQVMASAASQQANIVNRTSAAPSGATTPLVPHQTFSLWNRLQATRSTGLGLGVVQQSRMYAAINNTVTLPGFARLDGAVYVGLGRYGRAQVNVENLLNRRYTATSHGNDNIIPGAPRTLLVSVSATP